VGQGEREGRGGRERVCECVRGGERKKNGRGIDREGGGWVNIDLDEG